MKNIILHYHFFKNAGTSFDALLKANFPGKWVSREFHNTQKQEHTGEVAQWIQSEPDAIVFSSHTMEGPPPSVRGIKVFPFFFLRHPLIRIRSVYDFEKKQEPGESLGSKLAHNATFSQYLKSRLEISGDHQCRNFHCRRLGRWVDSKQDVLTRSKQALSIVGAFGIVERFEQSVVWLRKVLGAEFPNFQAYDTYQNVNSDSSGKTIESIRSELGSDFYNELVQQNKDDLALYEYAVEAFNARRIV